MILVIFKQVNLSLQKALFCELRYIHLPKLGFPISIKKGSFAETERTIVSLEFRLFRETKNVRNSVASHTSEQRRYRDFVTNHSEADPEVLLYNGVSCNASTLKRCITFRSITKQTMLLKGTQE